MLIVNVSLKNLNKLGNLIVSEVWRSRIYLSSVARVCLYFIRRMIVYYLMLLSFQSCQASLFGKGLFIFWLIPDLVFIAPSHADSGLMFNCSHAGKLGRPRTNIGLQRDIDRGVTLGTCFPLSKLLKLNCKTQNSEMAFQIQISVFESFLRKRCEFQNFLLRL